MNDNIENTTNDINDMFNNMTDEELKELFMDMEADYWIEESKNNPCLM